MVAGSISAYAGFDGLTAHSRANCLSMNESISWDATRNWDLRVESIHLLHKINGPIKPNQGDRIQRHVMVTGNKLDSHNMTWREAQFHFNDPMPNLRYFWEVYGTHYRVEGRKLVVFEQTNAVNCNMYDGWWNKDHPERASK